MKYTDPALTIDEQVGYLLKKGLTNDDPCRLSSALSCIGYFRLNKYMKYFLSGNRFAANTSINDIIGLYEYDKHLRSILIDALSYVEIAAKSIITSVMCYRSIPSPA